MKRRLLVVVVTAMGVGMAIVSPVRAATLRVLVLAPHHVVSSVVAGQSRIAWAQEDTAGTCFTVWVRADVSGVRRQWTRCRSMPGEVIGVTASNVWWDQATLSEIEETDSLFAAPFGPFRPVLVQGFDLQCGESGCVCGPAGDSLGVSATAGDNLVYSDEYRAGDPASCPGGGGTLLTGGTVEAGGFPTGHSSEPGVPVAGLLAGANFMFAELPATLSGQPPPTSVLVHYLSGPLLTTVDPVGAVQQIGLSKAGLGMEVIASGVHTLRLYNRSTGQLIHQVWIRRDAYMLAMSGYRILYANGNQLRTLNLIRWRTHVVATIPALSTYTTVLLDGRQVILHSYRHPHRIDGITLPRLP